MSKICLALIGFLFILIHSNAYPQNLDREDAWKAEWAALAAESGDGYMIWESNRTGRWRLWMRNLDGTGLHQLSRDEDNRDHYCPHLSPNGKWLLYLSYPKDRNGYEDQNGDYKVPLHLLNMETGEDREAIENARAYYEDRAAVWLNDNEFIYIGGDELTYQFNIKTGEKRRLTNAGEQEHGWLINSTKTYATSGSPTFSPYHADQKTISERQKQDGCQPYFSSDGVWGFWMGGAGGPIRAIHLATGETKDILEKNDPRLPRNRSYLYFPMLSDDSRFIAFGASPNQHDHFKADYDIFVARVNPQTLDVIGKPVRYTFDKGVDRFPTLFVRKLQLGKHDGEAPFTVTFTPEGQQAKWEWHFGDGTVRKAERTKYTYHQPGTYRVEATQGNKRLYGWVTVRPAQPPRPINVALRDKQEIVILFDEPIAAKKVKAHLESGVKVKDWKLSDDGYTLVLRLDKPIDGEDWLRIKGVTDRAQKPNPLQKQRLQVKPPEWPVFKEGLVFLWEDGNSPNLIMDSASGESRSYTVKPRHHAHLNAPYAMRLAEGAYLAEGADETLLNAFKTTNQLTVEAVVTADNLNQGGPARIITFSSDPGSRNFTLGQQDDGLIFRLRTPKTGDNGTHPEIALCRIPAGEPTHIVVTYQPGHLVCYRNGEKVLETDQVQGDFSNWTKHHLLFGDEWSGSRDWSGTLEGIAIYDRALSSEEAKVHAQNYRNILLGRRHPQQWTVQAKVIARSTVPTLEAISPYRQALVTYEYEVKQVKAGGELPKRIRVAHWVILDGDILPIAHLSEGAETELILEPFEDNRQLESFYLSDTLEIDLDMPLYYAVYLPPKS